MGKKAKETFSQGVFALMMSQVVVKILGLFYKLYLTNREGFGDEGNAIANGGFQIFALVLSLVAIGIPIAISKLVAENSAKGNYMGAYKTFKVAFVIFASFGILGSYALFKFSDVLANNYLHMPETKLSIIALCPSVFLVAVISVFKGYFSGRESIKMTANAQSLDQLTKTISTVLMIEVSIVLLHNTKTETMAAISNLATTLGNIVEFGYLYRIYLKVLPEIKQEIKSSTNFENVRVIKIVKQILIIAIPLSLTAIITTISKNIDSTTIVNDLKDIIGYEEAKNQYGILSGKVDALVNFPLSFNMAIVTALLPSIASANGNIKTKEGRINQSFLLGMVIALPITLVFFAFSDEILRLLFPNASSGGDILRISSFSIVFITIEQITNIILNGVGKNIVPIKAIAFGVIAKAVLNRLLVSRVDLVIGGTMGATIATLVCHMIASLISYVELIKFSRIKISILNIIKPAVASIIMVLISRGAYLGLNSFMEQRISLLVALIIGMVIYLLFVNKMMPISFFRIKRKKRLLSVAVSKIKGDVFYINQ